MRYEKTFGKVLLVVFSLFACVPTVAGEGKAVAPKPSKPKRFSDITIHDLEVSGGVSGQDFQGFEESDSRLLHMQTDVKPEVAELTAPRKHNLMERKSE